MVILVCGLSDEAPIKMVLQSLQKMGADFLMLDQMLLTEQVQLRWQLADGGIKGQLKVGDRIVDVQEIRSVYHRFMNPEDISDSHNSQKDISKARSILRALMDLFDILPARIVNQRRPMMSNNSKPYQTLLIRQAGFAIPETFITNDPGSLIAFASSNGPLIYKSISSVRSIVAPFDESSITKIETLRNLPTQFQKKIDGFNVRVHVIGHRLFATKISTSAVDYRYASQEGCPMTFKPFELNVDLHKQCLRLAQICQLSFAGIDLIVSPGKVYCLEVNPSPGYSYYQNVTGQPISDALAEYLVCE
jgi:glutathione synthase/RimK-type ligase-like ATP-grasp enzyme